MKPGIEPATPGLQGKWFIHYTTAAPVQPSSVGIHDLPPVMVATCECAHSTAHGPSSVVEQEPILDETSTQSMFHEDDIYPLVLKLHHGLDVQTISMLGMLWSLGQQSFGTSIGLAGICLHPGTRLQ